MENNVNVQYNQMLNNQKAFVISELKKQFGYTDEELLGMEVKFNFSQKEGNIVKPINGEEEIFFKFILYETNNCRLAAFRVSSYCIGNCKELADKLLKQKLGEFKYTMSIHNTFGFVIDGEHATPKLHAFLHRMLTNWTPDPCYKIHQEAGAFFQGGAHDPDGGWFYIEFWRPGGVKAFMDYLNANYDPEADE